MNTLGVPCSVGFWRRAIAVLVDLALLAFLSGLFGWIAHRLHADGDAPAGIAAWLGWLSIPVLVWLFWWAYQGTPGKLLMGCRIVDARSSAPARPVQLLMRLFGYLLSLAPAGLGFLWILWDGRRQG
ncbi:MAG: RDD family protein, partial [Thiohalobacteraceae bacterium]